MRYVSDLITSSKLPVAAVSLTETWWDGRVEDAQVNVPGYNLFRSDREFRTGGGCALLIHGSLIVTDTTSISDDFNNLIAVYVPRCHTILASIYRTGEYQYLLEQLQTFIDKHSNGKSIPDTFILGDLNLPHHNWEGTTGSEETRADRYRCETEVFTEENFLSQIVTDPTRGQNILDVILTNRPDYFIKTEVDTSESISDHKIVFGILGYDMTCATPIVKQNFDRWSFSGVCYHKANFEQLREILHDIEWDLLWEICDSVENMDCLTAFTHLLTLTILQGTCLTSPTRASSRISFKDRALTKMKSKRRRIDRRIQKLKKKGASGTRIEKLEALAMNCVTNIKEHLTTQLNKEEDKAVALIKENPRAFYAYAKKKRKTQSNVGPLRTVDGTLTDDPLEKSEILQSQYVKVFSDPDAVVVEEALEKIEERTEELKDVIFTPSTIEEALSQLKPTSAAPHGDVPALVLWECRCQLAYPLWKLWDKSFANGFIPEDLKKQQIAPIYKKGNKTLPESYRPVALTSHVTKTFERIVRQQLTEFVERTGVLNEEQHGFRAGRSTLSQLLNHYDGILEDMNKGLEVDVAYIDYAKAFDKVDIKILLGKLRKYGVRGKLLEWIEAFLTGRTQKVALEGKFSRSEPVLSSVIQGSVLGPLLFILYIADLVEWTSGHPLTFADDTKNRRAIKGLEDQEALQKDLDDIAIWSRNNNMLLHEDKYEVMNYRLNDTIPTRALPFTVMYYRYNSTSGEAIEPAYCVKDLGIYMTDDASWKTHISIISKEAKRLAGWTLGVFRDRSKGTMLTLLKSLIRPKLEYCCPLWSPCNIKDIVQLETVQRFFTRRVKECEGMDYWERIKYLRILSLQRRRERYMIIQVWKILHKMVPDSTNILFYNTLRHGPKAHLPKIYHTAQETVKTLREESFGVRAIQLFNRMPTSVRLSTSVDNLKVNLGRFLDTIPDRPPVTGYYTTGDNSLFSLLTEGK